MEELITWKLFLRDRWIGMRHKGNLNSTSAKWGAPSLLPRSWKPSKTGLDPARKLGITNSKLNDSEPSI